LRRIDIFPQNNSLIWFSSFFNILCMCWLNYCWLTIDTPVKTGNACFERRTRSFGKKCSLMCRGIEQNIYFKMNKKDSRSFIKQINRFITRKFHRNQNTIRMPFISMRACSKLKNKKTGKFILLLFIGII
jgi:hypothetical protein